MHVQPRGKDCRAVFVRFLTPGCHLAAHPEWNPIKLNTAQLDILGECHELAGKYSG